MLRERASALLRRGFGIDRREPVAQWMECLPDAEAAARRCLTSFGVPSWGSEDRPGTAGRFGLIFRSGRRALVMPVHDGAISIDAMASARCDYLILVNRCKNEDEWNTAGFVYWFESAGRCLTGERRCSSLHPRPMSSLPEVASRPSCYRVSRLIGSLRLLFLGDPPTPAPIDPGTVNGRI